MCQGYKKKTSCLSACTRSRASYHRRDPSQLVQFPLPRSNFFLSFVHFEGPTENAVGIRRLGTWTYLRVWSLLSPYMPYIMIRRSGQNRKNSTLTDSPLKRRPNMVLMTGCLLVEDPGIASEWGWLSWKWRLQSLTLYGNTSFWEALIQRWVTTQCQVSDFL